MSSTRKRTHSQSSKQEDEAHIKEEIPADEEDTYIKQEIDEDDDENAGQAQQNPSKKDNVKRRGRIIVRNLSFKTTENKLREHFKQFGHIEEVKLLRKPDGRLVGCGFIQFKIVQNASKAIYHTTGKPFLGRPIVCDWALGKDTYVKNIKQALQKEIKEEKDVEDIKTEDEIKVESTDKAQKDLFKIDDTKEEDSDKSSDDSDTDDDDKQETDDNSVSDEESDQESVKFEEPEIKKPKVISNDVSEGKTVFIKNVPFSVTNEELKECMSQFGELYYALICMDPITEHSKGTAFVKFKNKEDAEKCLAAGTELMLNGNILDCHRALSKNELQNKTEKKDTKDKKDSRNLYLVKEGVILAGSKAAEGLSAEDMAKRLDLERWKTQMLRNLNMFVSQDRLVVYNIPVAYDDKKLRQLIAKHVGSKAIIKEVRIMRDLKNLDSKGVGKSKEYGFVGFTKHEDALTALRNINNNPNIFTKSKRPIVAFSIENRNVLNARNKRLLKSKVSNPNYKLHSNEDVNRNKNEINVKPTKGKLTIENRESDFTGMTAKPGTDKLRTKYKLKTQAKLHYEHLKNEKRNRKAKKQLNIQTKQRVRQPKQKQNKPKRKEPDNFAKLVSDYKRKILASTATKKSKWYEP